MISRSLALCAVWLATLWPNPASAAALERLLAATWGSPKFAILACASNAKQPELIAPDLLRFHYPSGIWFPEDRFIKTLDYRILAQGSDWLRLEIIDEHRLFAGKPIVWRLEFTSLERFVWIIEGEPTGQHHNPQIRCDTILPTS